MLQVWILFKRSSSLKSGGFWLAFVYKITLDVIPTILFLCVVFIEFEPLSSLVWTGLQVNRSIFIYSTKHPTSHLSCTSKDSWGSDLRLVTQTALTLRETVSLQHVRTQTYAIISWEVAAWLHRNFTSYNTLDCSISPGKRPATKEHWCKELTKVRHVRFCRERCRH